VSAGQSGLRIWSTGVLKECSSRPSRDPTRHERTGGWWNHPGRWDPVGQRHRRLLGRRCHSVRDRPRRRSSRVSEMVHEEDHRKAGRGSPFNKAPERSVAAMPRLATHRSARGAKVLCKNSRDCSTKAAMEKSRLARAFALAQELERLLAGSEIRGPTRGCRAGRQTI
jgi:hypothetical protein